MGLEAVPRLQVGAGDDPAPHLRGRSAAASLTNDDLDWAGIPQEVEAETAGLSTEALLDTVAASHALLLERVVQLWGDRALDAAVSLWSSPMVVATAVAYL